MAGAALAADGYAQGAGALVQAAFAHPDIGGDLADGVAGDDVLVEQPGPVNGPEWPLGGGAADDAVLVSERGHQVPAYAVLPGDAFEGGGAVEAAEIVLGQPLSQLSAQGPVGAAPGPRSGQRGQGVEFQRTPSISSSVT